MENKLNEALPVIPLRNIVVFPAMIIPLYVGRKNSLAALDNVTKSKNKQVLLVGQKNTNVTDPETTDLFESGTLAKVIQLLQLPDGTIKALVEGQNRIRIRAYVSTEPFFKATYENIPEEYKADKNLANSIKQVVEKFDEFVKNNKKVPTETLLSIINIDHPGRLSDMIVPYLSLSAQEKQKLLEITNIPERLGEMYHFLVREIGLLDVEKKLHTKVQDQIEKVQKEYYLKEKLKAIQKELGTEGETLSEVEEYKQKIKAATMPDDVEKKALREVLRLEKLQSVSAEANVIRTYLDWLIDMPWPQEAVLPLDLKNVTTILDKEHFGLEDVKTRILEYLAVYQNTKMQSGSILLLVGPPGVGKTSIAQSIAKAMNRKFYRISLGGLRDEAELRGHRRTYVGALPGRIIQAIAKVRSKNPVILLDEIDKLSQDYKGDPTAALMEILDPAQNKYFTDHYLEVSFDLSDIFFIATANTTYDISKPLFDRMEAIRLSGYNEEEKVEIAKKYLIPRLREEHGITVNELKFTTEGLRMIIGEYTREAGLRNLERQIAKICRKFVLNKLERRKNYNKVSRHNMHHYLGVPKYIVEDLDTADEVGVAKGLAWTEVGGEIMPIETTVLSGKGDLILTGQMGKVMEESAKAALTYIRSRCKELGLPEDFYKKNDVHIHIPEGAIPKDGPSAGIAIASSIASAFSSMPVRGNVAMTGEITLRGRVLPIGGLKEKILAAHRNRVDTIILPADNKPELKEIAKKLSKKIKFVPVDSMDDVLFFAIKGYQKQNKDKKVKPALLKEDRDQPDNTLEVQ